MKKAFLSILILLPALMWAQSSSTYLPAEQMPTPQLFLPGPPALQDPLFYNDWVAYQKGKDIRETERGYRAIEDADTSVGYFMQRFGEAMGVNMTPENCPNIARYISKTFSTAKQANSKAKDFYARVRPYNQFHEDTPVKRSQNPNDNTSYPSGHTCRAWSTALALVAIDPDHQNEILKVGYDYGQSRVILGYHYQTDIEAARLVASTGIARLMGEKSFQEDMAAAKAELENLRKNTAPRIRTVIIAGQDNPDWEVNSIAIAKILRNSGLFSVDIIYSPSSAEGMSAIESGRYDLVVADYEANVSNNPGCNVVFCHAADIEGELKEGVIEVSSANHPVTTGLPAQWKHSMDEYDSNTGKMKNVEILYTWRKTPVVYTENKGQSRICHITIGQAGESVENNTAMQCTGYQTLLLRGAEWSATGTVTQTIPDDFPKEDEVSLRPDYKKRRSFSWPVSTGAGTHQQR